MADKEVILTRAVGPPNRFCVKQINRFTKEQAPLAGEFKTIEEAEASAKANRILRGTDTVTFGAFPVVCKRGEKVRVDEHVAERYIKSGVAVGAATFDGQIPNDLPDPAERITRKVEAAKEAKG